MKINLLLGIWLLYAASPFIALAINPSFLFTNWLPNLFNAVLGSSLVVIGIAWIWYVDEKQMNKGPRSVSIGHLVLLDRRD